GKVNGLRSNYAFGPSSATVYTVTMNGSKLALCNNCGSFSGVIFEPIDEYKGDIARSIFYMSTRYYTEDASWTTGSFANKTELYQWAIDILINWHHFDPVSTKEINRNNVVYGIQDNRNPYIDHPEWADSVFVVTPVGLKDQQEEELFTVYPNPSNGTFQVNSGKDNTGMDVAIYNALGQEQYHSMYTGEVNTGLAPGVYFLRLTLADGKMIIQKLIVE
ncbi:MAG TPA: endonuclease, partial [Bacteroidia bacterium]